MLRMGRRPLFAFATAALPLVAGCAAAGPVQRAAPELPDGTFVAGYHPYWAADHWESYPFDVLDRLYFFEAEARPDGSLELHGWPERWSEMVHAASAQGVGVTPTISMHDEDGFEVLFADADRIDRLVDTIVTMLGALPVSGVHLDFEVFRPVDDAARDGFTGFVAQLAARIRREDPSLAISIFTLAFDADDVYNERALGQIADYLVVQGYDYFSPGSEAAGPTGPHAGWDGLNWSTVVQRFDTFGVPRRKVVMSVPLFGYEWPVESEERGAPTRGVATTVPFVAPPEVLPELPRARASADEHGFERDPQSGTAWYRFETPDGWRQGWFDDAVSLAEKYDFVRRNGLGGIALFPLAYGDEEIWAGLRSAFGNR